MISNRLNFVFELIACFVYGSFSKVLFQNLSTLSVDLLKFEFFALFILLYAIVRGVSKPHF